MAEEQFHDGLIATWWSQSEGGPDIARFRRTIERSGQPVLDAGCGSGRLLLPYLQAGIDVDGSDRSAGMLQVCADRLAAAGLKTTLYTQALHELDLPRRFQTIIVVGVFGLGTTREQDVEALKRLRAHLVPGGTLAVDIALPWTNGWLWGEWARRPQRPQRWRPPIERALPDGSVIQIRGRVLSFDPLDQSRRQLIRVRLIREGRVEREEMRQLVTRWYLPAELRLLLERAGFRDVRMSGDDTDEPPNATSEVVVFEGVA